MGIDPADLKKKDGADVDTQANTLCQYLVPMLCPDTAMSACG